MLHGKQYLASGSGDETINVWNLSDNIVAATLTGHTTDVSVLVVYVKNGLQMLASGDDGSTINLWNLESNTLAKTLSGHGNRVLALAVYEKNDKTILISGSGDETIKLWDLDTYSTITTLEGHGNAVNALSTYSHNGKLYLVSGSTGKSTLDVLECDGKICLVSGSYDHTIKIWDLENKSALKTLKNDSDINAIVVFMNGDRACLASGDDGKNVKLWME